MVGHFFHNGPRGAVEASGTWTLYRVVRGAWTAMATLWIASVLQTAVHARPMPLVSDTEERASESEAPSRDAKVDLNRVPQWLEQMSPAAQRGYRHLVDSVYLPADLDEEVVTELQRLVAERRARAAARDKKAQENDTQESQADGQSDASASIEPLAREELMRYYGLTDRPEDPKTLKPLQYVVDQRSQWVMNCFACHGGSVYGKTLPGAPNNAYQLQTFIEDIRVAKLRLGKPLGHMEIGSMFMPLGTTAGTTNAVMFGVALMHFRDADLNVLPAKSGPPMVHHDMDPPAWWLLHRKTRIYADGFAQKGHRGLMQFMLVRENGPEKFREWESDFSDVLEFIESLRPPKFEGKVDVELAERGRLLFNESCARCHGTYGDGSAFPEVLVPIDEVNTDRVRLDALSDKHREAYGKSWFTDFGKQETWTNPSGYMAPPLDGVWASAPYFHNGSVPTLWHVLNPDERPVVWRRTSEVFNDEKVGLVVESLDEVPRRVRDAALKRSYFDTRVNGKSASGHDFPLELTVDERRAVLEYLKTL